MPAHVPSATDRPPPPAHAATGVKLGGAVLAFLAVVVLVITLEPFALHRPTSVHISVWEPDSKWFGVFDVLTNVVLFLPLGFVYALTRAAGETAPRAGLARAFGCGALLSAAIETTQLFEPERYPSPTDVLSNALGALAGAWLHRRLARRLGADTPVVGRLALQLPVMGLVYVTLPVTTLAALATADGQPRSALPHALGLGALAVFGGTLLGCVQRRHLGPSGAMRPEITAAAAAAWFAVGALPALAGATAPFGGGVVLAALAAWLLGRRAVPGATAERRFEHEAIARATPFLALYLALLPIADQAAATHGFDRFAILRHLEELCAFTVLGYLLAEAWGRREFRYRASAPRVALAAGGTAMGLAALTQAAGARAPLGAIAMDVLVRAAAAAYGGWIYHLQRAHVRALVAARRPALALVPAAPPPAIATVRRVRAG